MRIPNRLFGRAFPKEASGDSSLREAQAIVNEYDAALASSKALATDAPELPYPKNRIKAALVAAMRATSDASMRDHLKAGCVSLADWQEGVNTDALAFESAAKDLSSDSLKVAKPLAEAAPAFMNIQSQIVAEVTRLADELKSLGL